MLSLRRFAESQGLGPLLVLKERMVNLGDSGGSVPHPWGSKNPKPLLQLLWVAIGS